jgi:hypothetical protein
MRYQMRYQIGTCGLIDGKCFLTRPQGPLWRPVFAEIFFVKPHLNSSILSVNLSQVQGILSCSRLALNEQGRIRRR